MTSWPTVMVTGHRPQHLDPDSIEWIGAELHRVAGKLREEFDTTTGISGMAIGADMMWARSVLAHDLALWAHVPFPEQADVWPADFQAEHRRLLARATTVNTYGELGDLTGDARRRAATRLLHARNRGMIRVSDAVVAVYRPSKAEGGTAAAWRQAVRDGLPIIHINPDRRSVTQPQPQPRSRPT